LYKLYNAEDLVTAKVWRQFKHNYNQQAREMMYHWFNQHLRIGYPAPITEKPFVPVPPAELRVYDEEHRLPPEATDSTGVRKYLSEASDRQLAALKPKDAANLPEFRRVYGTALRVMIGDRLPEGKQVAEFGEDEPDTRPDAGYEITPSYIGRK